MARGRELWHNGLRNRWIAGLARATSEGGAQTLAKKYPGLAKTLLAMPEPRVGLLVENVDHAAQLLKRLPGWPIVADPVVLQHSLTAQVRQAVEAGQHNLQRCTADVIVTMSAIRSAGIFDVLIRADAGTGLPPIAEPFFAALDGTGEQLLLVDVEDRHHPCLRRRARWRKAAYVDRGWSVDGERAWHPSDACEQFAHGEGTVFRIGYISKRRKSVSAAARAYQKRRTWRAAGNGTEGKRITLKQLTHPDFLYECMDDLRHHGGPGTGHDGITYADLSPSEWGAVLQKLSQSLLAGRYRPQPTKKLPILKPGTAETRVLGIGSTCDRIVAHAFDVVIKPHLDPLFLPGSWGFRPARGVWQMLVQLKRTVEATERWVLAIDDVRKAFDNVPVDKLLEAMRKAQQDLKKRDERVTINDSVLMAWRSN